MDMYDILEYLWYSLGAYLYVLELIYASSCLPPSLQDRVHSQIQSASPSMAMGGMVVYMFYALFALGYIFPCLEDRLARIFPCCDDEEPSGAYIICGIPANIFNIMLIINDAILQREDGSAILEGAIVRVVDIAKWTFPIFLKEAGLLGAVLGLGALYKAWREREICRRSRSYDVERQYFDYFVGQEGDEEEGYEGLELGLELEQQAGMDEQEKVKENMFWDQEYGRVRETSVGKFCSSAATICAHLFLHTLFVFCSVLLLFNCRPHCSFPHQVPGTISSLTASPVAMYSNTP
ncbi:hypothetical protein DFS33DRAFT_182710 [Desarmillaria ectypa]|nr:hypothetical protein DFS33DRAFT_182710 [Desarmillaria ectypa]